MSSSAPAQARPLRPAYRERLRPRSRMRKSMSSSRLWSDDRHLRNRSATVTASKPSRKIRTSIPPDESIGPLKTRANLWRPSMSVLSNKMLPGLKARSKGRVGYANRNIDEVGARRGFVHREPGTSMSTPMRKKPGRQPSPRTRQLHPRARPATGQAFLAAAKERGLSQRQMYELLWEKSKKEQ